MESKEIKWQKNRIKLDILGSTVVEHTTPNPKFQGLNPATGMVRENIKKYSVAPQ
jgi:hypothetical protein